MHAIRAASAAVLPLTALGLTLTAPSAHAEDSGFQPRVTPSTIAAGGQVSVSSSSCSGETKVEAQTFDDFTLAKDEGSRSVPVHWEAKQGSVDYVTFTCNGQSQTVKLTVAGGRPESASPSPVPQGVKAGVGGSAGGLDVQEIALGGALIAGALGAAYYVTRRRTSDKGA
ncbi:MULTISPECIES: hypothetical protein [unclassified Streptomyces]|uniref:hypothetical protein n=1 Tax=unclassified Streptomyces TaxID=2593676 RepID=UPI00278C8F50|nr:MULTISPECIES: hypothetical protein [unclassified Streptomyces]